MKGNKKQRNTWVRYLSQDQVTWGQRTVKKRGSVFLVKCYLGVRFDKNTVMCLCIFCSKQNYKRFSIKSDLRYYFGLDQFKDTSSWPGDCRARRLPGAWSILHWRRQDIFWLSGTETDKTALPVWRMMGAITQSPAGAPRPRQIPHQPIAG